MKQQRAVRSCMQWSSRGGVVVYYAVLCWLARVMSVNFEKKKKKA